MSMIIYLYVKPLFAYYFLLIATMTKAMSANSQQLLFIVLFLCELITPVRSIYDPFLFFILFNFLKIIARNQSPQLKTTHYYIAHGLNYINRS